LFSITEIKNVSWGSQYILRGRERTMKKCQKQSLAWWFTPVIPALGRLRQEDGKFRTRLGHIWRLCENK
jgi:hypothetical protein